MQTDPMMLRSMPENATLSDIFDVIPKPRVALDIGCGIGRASVWLCK